MRKICIQSGHWNTTSGQTGAPREQERTIAIGLALTDKLRANGFEVYHTDARANLNPAVTGKDWDLFLSLHCDMDYAGNEGGGFVDWIDPSIDSSTASNKESERIAKAIEAVYFRDSGIRNVPSRRNANTKFYYMWEALSADTHCVIIEMGESIDPHDNVILNDTDRQANILLSAIKNAYPETVTPPVTPPTTDPCLSVKQELEVVKKQLTEKDITISSLTESSLNLGTNLTKATQSIEGLEKEVEAKEILREKWYGLYQQSQTNLGTCQKDRATFQSELTQCLNREVEITWGQLFTRVWNKIRNVKI